MTIPAAARKAGPFPGNGVATAFPFTFRITGVEDVVVYFTGADGVQLLLDPLDYMVEMNADQDATPGGSVVYPPGGDPPLSADESLDLIGGARYEQRVSIANSSNFSAVVVQLALDYIVILVQQLQEQIERCVRLPVGDASNTLLPSAAVRAGGTLVFDAQGNLFVSDVDFAALAQAAADSVVAAAAQAAAAAASAEEAEASAAIAAGGVVYQTFTGPGPWTITNGTIHKYLWSVIGTGTFPAENFTRVGQTITAKPSVLPYVSSQAVVMHFYV